MLTLTRRPGQSIQIGTDIVVTVSRVKGRQVQISITAPAHVDIKRSELEAPPPRRMPKAVNE